MLFAGGKLSHGRVAYAPSLTLERTFQLFTVERSASLWDTRYVRAQTPGTGLRGFYVMLEGWMRLHVDGAERVHGPIALASTTPPLEGPVGGQRLTLTAGGEPFRAVQFSVGTPYWIGPESTTPMPVAVPPSLTAAARGLLDLGAPNRADLVAGFIDECARAGLVRPELATTLVRSESAGFERTWKTITDSYLTLSRAPSRQELSDRMGISERQLSRDIDDLLHTYDVAWRGFRELSSDLRLRWAVLLLSADDVSFADVARAAAYGSVDALSRALRDAGLPSPRELRASILAAGS